MSKTPEAARAIEAAKAIEEALKEGELIHVASSPLPGDNPGEMVIFIQHPFTYKEGGAEKDLGRQFRITIIEDDEIGKIVRGET